MTDDMHVLPGGNYPVPATIPVSIEELIERYVAQVKLASSRTVEDILESARIVFEAEKRLHEEGIKAVKFFRTATGLSDSMLNKLKHVGADYALFSAHKDNLPPSLSTLYTLTRVKDRSKLRSLICEPLSAWTREALERRIVDKAKQPTWTIAPAEQEGAMSVAEIAADIEGLKLKYGSRIVVRFSPLKGIRLLEHMPGDNLAEIDPCDGSEDDV